MTTDKRPTNSWDFCMKCVSNFDLNRTDLNSDKKWFQQLFCLRDSSQRRRVCNEWSDQRRESVQIPKVDLQVRRNQCPNWCPIVSIHFLLLDFWKQKFFFDQKNDFDLTGSLLQVMTKLEEFLMSSHWIEVSVIRQFFHELKIGSHHIRDSWKKT